MDEILATAAITLAGGLLIFSVTEVGRSLILTRVDRQARISEQIAEALVVYAPAAREQPTRQGNEASQFVADARIEFRRLAGVWRANYATIPASRLLSLFKLIQSKTAAQEIGDALMVIANGIGSSESHTLAAVEAKDLICDKLQLGDLRW